MDAGRPTPKTCPAPALPGLLRLCVLLLALWFAWSAAPAWACAACGCGDGTLTSMGLEKPLRNRLRFSLEQRLSGRRLSIIADRPPIEVFLGRTVLAASFAPLARLSIGVTLPLGFLIQSNVPGPERWSTRRMVGLGDAELLVRGVVFQERAFAPRHLLWALAGLKAPTGPRINDSSGYPADEDSQPGTGTVDVLGGLTYGHFAGRLTFFVSSLYRHPVYNLRDYRRGFMATASAALQVSLHERLALGGGVDGSYDAGLALPDGRAVPGAGGGVLALTPSLLWSPRTDLLVRAALQVPVFQRWDGPRYDYPTFVLALVLDR